MVLSQQRGFRFSLSDASDEKTPNPVRIAATSTAIALHVVALLVLIAPVAAPPSVDEPVVMRVVPIWPKEKVPLPPKPPEEVPVTPPQNTTTIVKPQQNVVPVDVPIVSEEGTELYVPTIGEAGPVASANIDANPVAAVRLEYSDAPAPTYPRDAIRERRQGVVMLQVTVDVDGRPVDVVIAQSSGHRDLDAAARQQVLKRWRFKPAMKDGLAIQAIGMVPVNFTLNR